MDPVGSSNGGTLPHSVQDRASVPAPPPALAPAAAPALPPAGTPSKTGNEVSSPPRIPLGSQPTPSAASDKAPQLPTAPARTTCCSGVRRRKRVNSFEARRTEPRRDLDPIVRYLPSWHSRRLA